MGGRRAAQKGQILLSTRRPERPGAPVLRPEWPSVEALAKSQEVAVRKPLILAIHSISAWFAISVIPPPTKRARLTALRAFPPEARKNLVLSRGVDYAFFA
jgi:hypothetical protein